MHDWRQATHQDYRKKGLAARCGFGEKPVLLIVDFIYGFTDPTTPLGGDFSAQLEVTRGLLARFRQAGLPVIYTTVAYDPDLRDAGLWIKKVPALEILVRGTLMTQVDERIRPEPGEMIVEKKFASAFFGTDLDISLKARAIDTVVLVGCTTSGCIRASAIDSIQSGYHTIAVADGIGDRAEGPHQANLFDIDAKYGDVVESGEVHDYVKALAENGGLAGQAEQDFRQFWQAGNGSARV